MSARPATTLQGLVSADARRLAVPLALVALVALSALLRTRALGAGYWIDEGLSVGIASHRLADLPELLRRDGSPPLHYALLHGWIALFGSGEQATHALSLLCALATVPAAWWAAHRPLGARVAWAAAALAAANPFLTHYAQETRPYAVATLLGTLLAGAHLRAFVLGDRRAVVPAGLLAGALALTHHWGLFVVAGLALGTVSLARGARGVLRDGSIAAAVVVAVYAPWLGVTLAQVRLTGAPWSITPGLDEIPDLLLVPLAGTLPALLLVVAAGLALRRRATAMLATTRSAAVIGVTVVIAFAAAFAAAQVEPGWAGRYLAVICGPLLLLAAWAVAHAGVPGGAVLGVVLAVWVAEGSPQRKSNMREVAAAVSAHLAAGDLVVVAHPEQIAVARHYLGGQVRYATTLGPQPDARFFDWRNAVDRLRAADPQETLAEVARAAPAAQRIVLLLPVEARTENRRSPWIRLVRARARAWQRLLDADRARRRVLVLPRAEGAAPPRRGVRAVVYARAGTA